MHNYSLVLMRMPFTSGGVTDGFFNYFLLGQRGLTHRTFMSRSRAGRRLHHRAGSFLLFTGVINLSHVLLV